MASADTVARVLALLADRSPTLGTGRLVCLDGPAGSGKTTIATALQEARPDARVVHMDDLYAGWDGLPRVEAQLDSLLTPLTGGHPGRYRRWDWHVDEWAEDVVVDPGPLLVVEGVGSGSGVAAALATVLVWVEAPYDVRRRRALERDGDVFAPHWEAWAGAEDAHFAQHRTRERADLVVDAAGGSSYPT